MSSSKPRDISSEVKGAFISSDDWVIYDNHDIDPEDVCDDSAARYGWYGVVGLTMLFLVWVLVH